jgi:hypothetical protein
MSSPIRFYLFPDRWRSRTAGMKIQYTNSRRFSSRTAGKSDLCPFESLCDLDYEGGDIVLKSAIAAPPDVIQE